LTDEDEDVREESAIGLGRRQDRRVIPVLLTMLDDYIIVRPVQAATALLGLDRAPPEWTAADYQAAIRKIAE
jgi:HEAT repeat protein